MMQNPVHITDIFQDDWMAAVRTELNALATPITVYSQTAHLVEVLENLQQLDASNLSALKFPLVILLCDVPERIGGRRASRGQYQYARCNIIIATSTVSTFKQPERLEKNFKPVLYPIYYALLRAIQYSKYTSVYNSAELEHTKTDRYSWGKEAIYGNKGNIANDYIDAIEIKDLDVKISNKFCLQS